MHRRSCHMTIALISGVLFGATLALVADGQSNDAAGEGGTISNAPIDSALAAGDQAGLWIALRSAEGGGRLLHRTATEPDGVLRAAMQEPGPIQALSGGGERCFIVFEDRTVQTIRRDVDPRTQRARYTRGQFPPLPPIETVVDVASVGARLFLLVDLGGEASGPDDGGAPSEAASEAGAAVGPEPEGGDTASTDDDPTGEAAAEGQAGTDEAASGEPTPEPTRGLWLIDSVGSDWHWTAMPEGVTGSDTVRLVGQPGGALALAAADGSGGLQVFERNGEGWSAARYDHDPAEGWRAVGVAGEWVLIEPIEGRRALRVRVLWEGAARDGGRLTLPEAELADWAATAYGDQVSVVAAGRDGRLWLAQRRLSQKADAEPTLQPLRVEPLEAPMFNEQLVFYGLLALAVLSVLAVRRMDRSEVAVELPDGLMPAPLGRRLVALLIDLAPSVIVAMAVFSIGDPTALLMPWLALSSELEALAPAAAAIALTAIHGAIAEMLIGGSIGKRLVGLRTVSVKGGPIDWKSVTLRNLLKMIELLLWPLALFALLNEPHQRMGDLVGRTVVVVRIGQASGAGSDEASEPDGTEDQGEGEGEDGSEGKDESAARP